MKSFLILTVMGILACSPDPSTISKPATTAVSVDEVQVDQPEIQQQEKETAPLKRYQELKKIWEDDKSMVIQFELVNTMTILADDAEFRGDFETARKYWREILEIEPDNPYILQKIQGAQDENSGDGIRVELSLSAPTIKGHDGGTVMGTHHFPVHVKGRQHFKHVDSVIHYLEEAYLAVGSRLSLYSEEPVHVYLYTDQEFQDLTGLPPWVRGVYDGNIHLPVANMDERDPLIEQVIYHEYTHAIIFRLTGNRCPLWLNEGLAMLMEPQRRDVDINRLIQARKKGVIQPISTTNFISRDPYTAALLYDYALSMTDYLMSREGYWALGTFFTGLREGKSVDDAFQEAYFYSMGELEKRFIQSLN